MWNPRLILKRWVGLNLPGSPIQEGQEGLKGVQDKPPKGQLENPLSSSPLSPPKPKLDIKLDRLFWCSFKSPNEEFIGVVICRGASPGSAANSAIQKGIVEAERASICPIPLEKEAVFLPFADRLLSEIDIQRIPVGLKYLEATK